MNGKFFPMSGLPFSLLSGKESEPCTILISTLHPFPYTLCVLLLFSSRLSRLAFGREVSSPGSSCFAFFHLSMIFSEGGNMIRRKLHAFFHSLLSKEFRQLALDIRILQRQNEFLLRTCHRKQRRQWVRILKRELAGDYQKAGK